MTHHLSHTTLSHTTLSRTIFHTPSSTHHLSAHPFSHTTLSQTIFDTPSFTHNFVTHTHTIFHTPLCHTQFRLCHTPSLTHHLSHTTLSHTTLSHTIFHTPSSTHHLSAHHFSHTTLSHTIFYTPSFTHHFVTQHLSPHHFVTHHFVTHHLSHTTLSHTLFHTQLSHTPSFTHNFFTHAHTHTHHLSSSHTIFHMPLCHTQLCFTSRSSTASFVFPSFPGPATTLCAHYWKKLSCGVIRSFNSVLKFSSSSTPHLPKMARHTCKKKESRTSMVSAVSAPQIHVPDSYDCHDCDHGHSSAGSLRAQLSLKRVKQSKTRVCCQQNKKDHFQKTYSQKCI